MFGGVEIIAEVKTKSPFGFSSSDPWDDLFQIANEIGDIVSIHTDKRWGGSFELLAKARRLTEKPILAKGIHSTDDEINQAIKMGADFVLVVGRVPKVHFEKCFIEPRSINELNKFPTGTRVVWNERDLATGEAKKESFESARKAWKGWLCQASYLRSASDIKKGADAVLVGTNLKDFAASLK